MPTSLARMLGLLDRCQIARDTVTLVLDKGSAALANTVALQEAGVGWISALPWNQAPTAWLGTTAQRQLFHRALAEAPAHHLLSFPQIQQTQLGAVQWIAVASGQRI